MGAFGSPFGDYDRKMSLDGTQQAVVLSHFQQNTPVTIGNTAVETSIFTTGVGSRTFGAGWFNTGSIVRIHILGSAKTLNAAQTIQFKVKLGAVTILDSGAVTTPALGSATAYRRDVDFSFASVGATGSCNAGTTQFIYGGTPASIGSSVVPATSTVNTTASNLLDITYTWGAADAANVIIVYGVVVECLG